MGIINEEIIEKVATKYNVDKNTLEAVADLINESYNNADYKAFMNQLSTTLDSLSNFGHSFK